MKTKIFNKKVSNQELIKSLKESIQYNDSALDYIENEIRRKEDVIKITNNSLDLECDLKNLKYIQFALKYLSESYNNTLRSLK